MVPFGPPARDAVGAAARGMRHVLQPGLQRRLAQHLDGLHQQERWHRARDYLPLPEGVVFFF